MTHQDLGNNVPFYAIDALEKIERQALEAHLLSGCVPCHTMLKEYQSVAAALPFQLRLVPPPHDLKTHIMNARTLSPATEEADRSSTRPSLEPGDWMNHLFPPSASSAPSFGQILSVMFLVILGILAFLSWNTSSQHTATAEQVAELQAQAAETQATLAALQRQLKEREEALIQTQDALQQRSAELAEVKDQLIQREAEVDTLKAQSPPQRTRPSALP